MKILTLVSLGTDAAGEEEAEVRALDTVPTSVSTILANIAAILRSSLRQICVFAITPRPFIVPYIEDGASLGWGLGRYN